MAQTIGLVLAGGEGRRMGRPKGSLVVGESTLATRAARILHPICGNVLISIARGGVNPAPAFDAVEDGAPAGRGPLAGIAAAFASTGKADLLVLACDYPAVGTPFLQTIRDAAEPEIDLVFPIDTVGRDHPLVALWRRSAEAHILEALREGTFKVQVLFPELALKRLRPEAFPGEDLGRVLGNVNWPADLAPFAERD